MHLTATGQSGFVNRVNLTVVPADTCERQSSIYKEFQRSRPLRLSSRMTNATVERERRKAVFSTRWLRSTSIACAVAAGTLVVAPAMSAQTNALESARELYTAAAYDDALAVLNELRASDQRKDIGRIEYYRALCLLAVGRAAEADAAIEAAVTAAPFAQPSEADTSPRVRSAFREVRRRILPGIIEQKFADAKTAFDRRDSVAAEQFTEVVALIDDSEFESLSDQRRFTQVRALATDYAVLSAQRQTRR